MNILKIALFILIGFNSLNVSAETYKVIQQFGHILQNGCVEKVNPDVKFGQFAKLDIENCKKMNSENWDNFISILAKLDTPFSHENKYQLNALVDAFASELSQPREKIIEGRVCGFSKQNTGVTCLFETDQYKFVADATDSEKFIRIAFLTKKTQKSAAVSADNSQDSPLTKEVSFIAKSTGFGRNIQVQHENHIEYKNKNLRVTSKVSNPGSNRYFVDENYNISLGEISKLVISQPTKSGVADRGITYITNTFRLDIYGSTSKSFSNNKQNNSFDFDNAADLEEVKNKLVNAAKIYGKSIEVRYE